MLEDVYPVINKTLWKASELMLKLEWMRTIPLRLAASYLRNTSCSISRWRIQLFAIREARHLGSSMGTKIVRTRSGIRASLVLSDWFDQQLYATGEYEPDVMCVVEKLLSPGDCVIDIGANIGFFSFFSVLCVGPSGTVHVFEPAPSIRKRLDRNLTLNPGLTVIVHTEALSNRHGSAPFFVGAEANSGTSSLRNLSKASATIQVNTIPFDEVPIDIDSVRLITIDVEGAEIKVLEGMRQSFSQWSARLPDIVIEVSEDYLREMGGSAFKLCEMLIGMGYQMYEFRWNGLVAFDRWSAELPNQFNALFTARAEITPGVRILNA